jgi:hypothetical protein
LAQISHISTNKRPVYLQYPSYVRLSKNPGLIILILYLFAILFVVVAPLISKVAPFPDYVLKVLHHHAWHV